MGSGDLVLAPSDLKAVFGRAGIQLVTDDGRLLDLRFSEKELSPAGRRSPCLRDRGFAALAGRMARRNDEEADAIGARRSNAG